MKHLVIGQGQIGKAVAEIFKCDSHDIKPLPPQKYNCIHITIPYSKNFIKIVKEYKKRYQADYVVIHSTVPVGTSKKLNAVHSPVNGKHPELKESILTFTKLVSGKDAEIITKEMQKYFIPAKNVGDNTNNTEAGKLWNLNIYGINIMLEKQIHQYCKDNNLDWNIVYKEFIKLYNQGYKQMGLEQFQMYDLDHVDGKLGGHCVIQNMPILKTPMAKLLLKLNNKIK